MHQPDKYLNALIGDAVSALRSVLDYIAVAIVSPITGSTKDIGFPFSDNSKDFSGKFGAKTSLGLCDDIVINHFINEVQAYKGGKGEALWALNKLRNIDKHRLLISTVNIAGVYLTVAVGSFVMRDNFHGIPEGQTVNLITFPPDWDVDITSKPCPAFEVRFSEPPYINNTPVLGFLHGVSESVEHLLDAISVL